MQTTQTSDTFSFIATLVCAGRRDLRGSSGSGRWWGWCGWGRGRSSRCSSVAAPPCPPPYLGRFSELLGRGHWYSEKPKPHNNGRMRNNKKKFLTCPPSFRDQHSECWHCQEADPKQFHRWKTEQKNNFRPKRNITLTCTVGAAGWQWWWQRARTRGKGRTSGGRYCSATRTGRVLVFHHPQCQTLGKKMKTHKNPSKPHRFNLTCSDYRKDAAHWIVPVKDVLGERFQDLWVGL